MPTPTREIIGMIREAMIDLQPVTLRITYIDSAGEVTEREVEPYELKGRGDEAILYAWCLTKESTRQFKIAGISECSRGSGFRPRFPIKSPL